MGGTEGFSKVNKFCWHEGIPMSLVCVYFFISLESGDGYVFVDDNDQVGPFVFCKVLLVFCRPCFL